MTKEPGVFRFSERELLDKVVRAPVIERGGTSKRSPSGVVGLFGGVVGDGELRKRLDAGCEAR
jgi:hypothetical protein